MTLSIIRRNLQRLARFNLALFVVCWAVVMVSPCVMAMQLDDSPMSSHDCPHCPPQPCHGPVVKADCNEPEPQDRPRSVDSSEFLLEFPVLIETIVFEPDRQISHLHYPSALARDGPRTHLLYVRFDE